LNPGPLPARARPSPTDPVQLYVAGTSHHDSMGKPNLRTWLGGLAVANDGPPLFVAVQYDEAKFVEMKNQRPVLRRDLSMWRTMPTGVLNALVDGLAYEPEGVLEMFPGVEIVWLEAGTTESAERVHRVWFAKYQRYADLKAVDFLTSDPNPLLLLSEATWECFGGPGMIQPPEPRDEKLARVILHRLRREKQPDELGSGRWAVVVVGANHTRNEPGRMLWRLAKHGVPCSAVRIETRGPVAIWP
jgi:hypothetical protein